MSKKKNKKPKDEFDDLGDLSGLGESPGKKSYYGYGSGWDSYYNEGGWSNYRTPGESASSFWANNSWSRYSGTDEESKKWKFKGALYNVANAANVPANNIGGGERQLRVKWARNVEDAEEKTDNSNKLSNETIILSPDVIDDDKSRKSKWTTDERQDVLVSDAMTLAAMKTTASPQSEADVERFAKNKANKEVGKVADQLWSSQETIIAEKAVLEQYPGFAPYYAAYRDYWSDKGARETLENQIGLANSMGINWLDGAAAATRFEQLYPDQKLNLPKAFREAVDAAKAAMPIDANMNERGKNAIRAAQEILRILPQKEEKTEPDSESGEDGKKNDGEMPQSGDPRDDEGEDGEGEDGEGKPGEKNGIPKFGQGRDSLSEQEQNTDFIPEKTEDGEMAKSDKDGVLLGDTLEREILDEDTWRGGTDHVMVKVHPDNSGQYKELVSSLKGTINAVKARLKLRQEKPNLMLHGLRRGVIDEGSMYKLAFGESEPLIFEQPEILNRIDLAFGLLIDESGSMNHGRRDGKTRVQIARDVAIVLAEAIKGMEGLELAVLGHTAQSGRHDGSSEGVAVHHYFTPDNPNLETLARSQAFGNNLDGYAMLESVRKMLKWYPHVNSRTLFVISDGQPSGDGYGGNPAMEHMFRVCTAARHAGVEVFGIGIDNAYSEAYGCKMYGEGQFVVLANAADSMPLLCKFVVDAVRKTCVLDVQ